jgi:hypothetical protein
MQAKTEKRSGNVKLGRKLARGSCAFTTGGYFSIAAVIAVIFLIFYLNANS